MDKGYEEGILYSSSLSSLNTLAFSEAVCKLVNEWGYFVLLGNAASVGGGGDCRGGGTSYSSVRRSPLVIAFVLSYVTSCRLPGLRGKLGSGSSQLDLVFKLTGGVWPDFGDRSHPDLQSADVLEPWASLGHHASCMVCWSHGGATSARCSERAPLLSGGMGGGRSGGRGGSLRGGGGAGRGLSCFRAMHGEDFGDPVGLAHGDRTTPF